MTSPSLLSRESTEAGDAHAVARHDDCTRNKTGQERHRVQHERGAHRRIIRRVKERRHRNPVGLVETAHRARGRHGNPDDEHSLNQKTGGYRNDDAEGTRDEPGLQRDAEPERKRPDKRNRKIARLARNGEPLAERARQLRERVRDAVRQDAVGARNEARDALGMRG